MVDPINSQEAIISPIANTTPVASRLYACGVTQLVPIPPRSKGPNSRGWQHTARSLSTEAAASITSDFGILGDVHSTLDCDTSDPLVTAVVADVANEIYGARQPGGRLTHRIGNKGFASLFVREGSEFAKAILRLVDSSGAPHGDIELRGFGHQTKYHGTAGASGAVYMYEDASGRGGVEKLVESAERGLPAISRESFLGTFKDALQRRLAVDPRTRHLRLRVEVAADATLRLHTDRDALLAPSPELLVEAAPFVRNGEDVDRDEYRNVITAFKGAGGEDARELAEAYSERWEGGYNSPEYFAQTWESIEPRHLGWDLIRSKAHDGGWQDAFLDFEAVPGAVAPEAAPVIAPFETRLERIACLHQSPTVAFDLATVQSDDSSAARAWYDKLDIAARGDDPLLDVWLACVLPAAERLSAKRYSAGLFGMRLARALSDNNAFTSLAQEERTLLIDAAFLLTTPPAAFDPTDPGLPVTGESASRAEDIILGRLPRKGQIGVFGQPGAGKSFVMSDLALLIGRGVDDLTQSPPDVRWLDASVAHGSVIYCSSEAAQGLKVRHLKWERRHGASPNVLVLETFPDLSNFPATVAYFSRAIRLLPADAPALALIVVDVLISALGAGKDENNNMDVSAALGNLRRVGKILGCATGVVHHSGKSNDDTARGASSFRAALDMEVRVSRVGNTTLATITKLKEQAPPDSFKFHLEDGVLVRGAGETALVASDVPAGVRYAHLVHAMSIGGAMVMKKAVDSAFVEAYCAGRTERSQSGTVSKAAKDAVFGGWIEAQLAGKGPRGTPVGFTPTAKEPPVAEMTP